jgi:hypothetical protein
LQTKGKGFSGRFSVPGMKSKKKKVRRQSLTKQFDEVSTLWNALLQDTLND